MPVVVVGSEKTFAALRPRLFEGSVSNRVAGDVKESLRLANPHVNLDRLTPGTVLSIPASANVRVRGNLSLDETTRSAVEGLSNAGKRSLDDIAAAATRVENEARSERKRVLKSLDAIGATPVRDRELAKEVETARKAFEEEDGRSKQRAALLKQAQAEWTADLEALKQLLD